jgi:hypothetical protein
MPLKCPHDRRGKPYSGSSGPGTNRKRGCHTRVTQGSPADDLPVCRPSTCLRVGRSCQSNQSKSTTLTVTITATTNIMRSSDIDPISQDERPPRLRGGSCSGRRSESHVDVAHIGGLAFVGLVLRGQCVAIMRHASLLSHSMAC